MGSGNEIDQGQAGGVARPGIGRGFDRSLWPGGLRKSQENKRTLQFSSYSPAFFFPNKIRLKDVKRRVNKVQTHGDRPNHMSSGYSKRGEEQNGWFAVSRNQK